MIKRNIGQAILDTVKRLWIADGKITESVFDARYKTLEDLLESMAYVNEVLRKNLPTEGQHESH